ncbi:uncharacterized protein LOC115448810 isoform X1 [Manduca sexta]|uniref:uncharacterized protein LOC115448810 isoform X1 n=1 Tax=Manduca sexta TaxID=7130 RepID=UPI00189056BB|nr:uncharacterized protein LOC115448810 isoform X1 [Manduca sexta]XP_037300243.1 uncharacterized protein LOC115448810 isoform X1 [Manduca sexta]XP_037300244.1 uncharacterized protein LOC115448810 isoform X1 [Manduca sexta]XP_037300245.1 uncharacterized protein LOC115448810 isoform X1 [Manduca sexta]XP_037300246.1 uncharacterized protein LOC115448810 isoform X1 [Manduca sexta]XP_037300247.1 uncharacterized protein LOC115448810 isoform X1 [Manduca sexta]XP_037300248.1 uncharacterized protein LO
MIETKEEMETIGEEVPPTPPEDVECRACLQRFDYEAGLLDMFQAWEPPWNGMGESIAQDLARLANVNITIADSYSKLICQFCHQKLLEACSFVVNVRINDRLLRRGAETLHEQDDTWPKPIQVDRNINSNVFNSTMDVEIKQEVLSDDEIYPSGAEDTFKDGTDAAGGTDNTFNNMEIKIEPEEIIQPAPFQITVNETSRPSNTKAIRSAKSTAIDENVMEPPSYDASAGKRRGRTAKSYPTLSPVFNKYAKKIKNPTSDTVDACDSERPHIFSDAQELELADYLLIARKLCHGLTPKIVRQFAYQYASGNINTYAPTWSKHEAATYSWFYKFMNRHKQLTMKVPESASLSRDNGRVGSFFESLKNLLIQYDFSAGQIWNVDETAITTIHKQSEMVGGKPLKQGGKVTSGDTVTVCGAINALGGYLPPFIIFPRKGWQKKLIARGLPGTEGVAHVSGCMTGAKFLVFLKSFVKQVRCSKKNPCLIILDSHESHITIDSITFCKDSGIELLTTPPYMSQKLQPLSPIFMQLRLQYSLVCDTWIGIDPSRPLTIANFAECLGKAYPNVMNTTNIQNSFANIGICPFNPSVFTDDILSPDRDAHNMESMLNEESVVTQHASLYILPESVRGSADRATNDISESKVSKKRIKEENIE